ncbi:ADP-ribosyltransferse [Mycobacterium sp. 1245111.1]|uniref:ADP-ribosyltransferse n=1 Tax=Mycobacterium sp. 1245111.1 TaxID=1834073 RepID=UPI0012EA5EA6|nr:ADP-ribosyltransferse [Mycobacterium sp. 1245111.1]
MSTLTAALGGCQGMSGDDPAGAAFGRSYDNSSTKLLEAMATTRNGVCRLGDGVRVSAHNYSVAEAHSNISGQTEALPSPHPTGAISAGSTPSSVGRGVGVPAGWGWVANYIGMIWPTGNSAKLRGAAAAWISAGTNFQVSEILGAVGPMSIIGAQQIPEGPAIAAAFTETNRCATGILQQCTTIATHLTSYASKIDTVHAAIIDLLSRICNPTTGIKEVWELLTDEDEDEIKKIANDIRVIVNQFTAEVHALGQQIEAALTEAKTILSTMAHYAEKEWDHFLHATDVGRALDHVGRVFGGFVTEAEGTLKGIWNFNPLRAVVDPKGFWQSISGSLEHLEALTGLDGGQKAEEAWKEEAKGLVHWDEWSTDPFTAAGETIFDVATALIPGGALSKVSKLGRLGADAAEAPKGFHVPTPTRLPNPAPHENPPQRNEPPHSDPPKGGQPGPAPTAKGALPPYGATESKVPTTPKPTTGTEPKPPVGPAQPAPGHESAHTAPTASAPDTPTGTAPGIASPAPQHAPSSLSSGHAHGGGDDPPMHGLTDEKRDEILATPKGSRPDPSEYLSPEYIEQHLEKFNQGGTRFMLQENLDKYGIGQRDGTTFLFPTSEIDTLIAAGNLGEVESALGLPNGYFKDFDVIRVDVPGAQNYNVRIPSGNEAGANEYWLPGGLLPEGMSEAVIDGSKVLPDDLIVVDLEDFGGK